MKGSLTIIGFFILGIIVSRYNLLPMSIIHSDLSFYTLCGLMFFVGVNIGSDKNTLENISQLNLRYALLPIMTILGTLAGCVIVSLFLSNRSISDCCAVGSGLGYYSLSSVIITEYRGAELGTIALLCNIMREIVTLLCAPILVKYFGKLTPISMGGATTADTTLPIITQSCGKNFIVISILHGCMVDFSVPFLVTFFCSL
ncbi:lysine exporter LysO family protein [uncultured Bacteroides sp.]|uniref:lysine exporter LysO family protein n=1 Tax=uncultured Bacteroides sp. TaxID=162156 RepID=UPI002AAC0474|nr:lysine exporter LysO family protein [uncultured Bacteroides sp.]